VSLRAGDLLIDVDREIEHVYFPVSGVLSIVGLTLDRRAVEVVTAGKEGMLGVPVALGARSTALQAFAQVPGTSLRLGADALRHELERGGALRRVLNLYAQALFTQAAQASVCNRLHSVEERCARWLLLMHDRVGGEAFELTQQFLSQMLGVRRASVSEVASRFQARGLLRYTRGQMQVLDREGLEEASCECYAIVRSEFDRLLGTGTPRHVFDEPRRRGPQRGRSHADDCAPRSNPDEGH
jgi:CRP-like cAMP-binding protein